MLYKFKIKIDIFCNDLSENDFFFRKFQSRCVVWTLSVHFDSHDSGGQCLLQADSEAQAKQPHIQCLQTILALYNDIKMSKT